MRTTILSAVAALTLSLATGCAGINIEPETPPASSPSMAQATLVVGEITHPRDLTVAAPFYVAMQREASHQLAASHIARDIMDERDLGPTGVSGQAFALRYRVVEDVVVNVRSGLGCRMALIVTGSLLIIPAFFAGMCTQADEHRLTVEARVYDLQGAAVTKIRDDNSNELVNVFDTTGITPILRKEYPVVVRVSSMAGAKLSDEELLEAYRKEAGEAMRQILRESLEDVNKAMTRPSRR